jgi:hypothetical protein
MQRHRQELLTVGAIAVTAFLGLFMMLTAGSIATAAQGHTSTNPILYSIAHETETEHPEATETEHPRQTGTPHPEGTETERPEATETEHPEGTETEHPRQTGTPHPEGTETEHPRETGTPHPEGTETEHPRQTGTPHPGATETEHPRETETAQPNSAPVVPGSGSRTYGATGKAVSGIFLQYWDKRGGLMQQGLPISNVMRETSALNGKAYTMQYFERAVFEYHPENKPPFDILLSQLGTFQLKQKYPNGAPNQAANKTNGQYFPETNHWVGGSFLTYWKEHGGLAQQGYPLTEEFQERSDLDGKTYTVQYFERAVFERHLENKSPFDVLLSQLGTFQLKQKYGK